MMTGKERLDAVLHKRSSDTICWTTLVDNKTTAKMPPDIKAMTPFEFYRHVGCDIMQFGSYGTGKPNSPVTMIRTGTETSTQQQPDGSTVTKTESKWGTLTSISQHGHPVKYPVETIEDLRVLKNIWLNSRYQEDDTQSFENGINEIVKTIGNDGIMVNTLRPSPVQQLLEFECGVINFYHLYQDHPDEIQELLDVMHSLRKTEYEITARRTPLDCVITVENTSTAMISPGVYEQLSLPQISDFVDIMHAHGKIAVLHMCGHLKDLLPLFRETGCDGIHAVTPPPLGDTMFENVLDILGEDFLIFGGIFNPFQKPGLVREELWHELDKLYTPRIRNANLLLWMGADGQAMPYENFIWVREWFENHQ